MLSDKVAERLFRQYSKRLYNTAFRITLSEDEADEIMQETLIRFITGKGVEIKDRIAEKTESPIVWSWLRTTCVRLSIDWLRSRKRFISLDAAIGDSDRGFSNEGHSVMDGSSGISGVRDFTSEGQLYTNEDDMLWKCLGEEAMPLVLKVISELPDGYRTILTLKLIEEYEYPEISAAMGISEAGVRSQYMRARRKVAEKLRQILPLERIGCNEEKC